MPKPDAIIVAALRRMGIVEARATPAMTPLAGGVSSDIWRADLLGGSICVKRALPRLKVDAVWEAPVERNRYEWEWMREAGRIAPSSVPRLIARDAEAGCFAMEFLDPAAHPLWKSQLRAGVARETTVRAVGERLVAIHNATAGRADVQARFATDDIFYAIRLEPYLVATAARHPDLASPLRAIVARTANAKHALVHGDVSPKNILIGADGPIFLDAECAWYGDPAFDLAFCLNHLLLKCLWTPSATAAFLRSFDTLAETYLAEVRWETRAAIEERAAHLLPGLFLARVDGKSPVEYVTTEADRARVRRTAHSLLLTPPATLAAVREAWAADLDRPVQGVLPAAGAAALRSGMKNASRTIEQVSARRVWDSRGRPTVEAEVRLASGVTGRAISPAGASTGSGEAVDLRDGGTAFGGHDVTAAVRNVDEEIAPVLRGRDATDQGALDRALVDLDGTPNRSRLGGNALIAVSMAALHAAAGAAGQPLWRYLLGESPALLPLPEIQIFGGGAHAGRRVDIQDFMVMPVGASTFAEALDWAAEVYRAAGARMAKAGRLQGVADEGGYWPAFDTNEEALEFLVLAIEDSGRSPGHDLAISLDVAASEFHEGGRYRLGLDGRAVDSDGLIELLLGWIDRYPIASIEDPLAEDDVAGMRRFTAAVGNRVQIIGDDYLVTSAGRVEQAARDRACNALLVKPNQAGTVTETRAALDAARAAGFATIVSARSGETEDVTIAHLAVGWRAGQLKVGSFARSERMAKWNEVLRIEEALGDAAVFAGAGALNPPRPA